MDKSICITYILWLTLGWFGAHHFYLKRYRQGFVWWSSFGGCFGLGWIRDLWRIPDYVSEANETREYLAVLTAKMTAGPPSFNFARFAGEVFMGWVFGLLGSSFFPEEYLEAHKSLILIAPFFTAIGVYVVGNIGREKVRFSSACLGAFIGLIWLWHDRSSLGMPAFLSALACNFIGKDWRRTYQKTSYAKSFVILTLCGTLYLALWGSTFYHNAHVETGDGEKVKVKDAFEHFFNSPAWREMKSSMHELWKYYQKHGFNHTAREFYRMLDPEGEAYAYEVLEVSEDATEEEIKKAYKAKAKEWHPDRVKDPELKEEASQKFMEIQKAYETLSTIKSRRTARQNHRRH